MKKILITALIFSLLLIFPTVKAKPTITEFNITPSSVWLGKSVLLSLRCYDDQSFEITDVYALVNGPNIIFQKNLVNDYDDIYSATIDSSYIDRIGQFTVAFYCKNNTDVNTTLGAFSVSKLTTLINSVSPSPGYVGDVIEIDVDVRKDDVKLLSDITFQVFLGGEERTLKQDPPVYDTTKGWMLKVDAPSDEGIYDIEVIAKYDRAEATATSTIEIEQPLEFELVDIDKTWVRSGENITMTFKALFKGKTISLRSEYLSIWINSIERPIQDISQVGDYSYVKISAPQLSAGSYDMKIRFSYMEFVKEISRQIEYVVPISGEILDSDGKAVYVQLEFIKDSIVSITTDGSGSYSGYLPFGIYDVRISFPSTTIILSSVTINNFNDPIKFDHPTTDIDIPGIKDAGVFVFEVVLTYSDAYIEMKYDDSKITDESRISVYKCQNWNFGSKMCSGGWDKIDAETDTVRNLVKLNSSSLSAYAIGYRKSITAKFELDKDVYNLKDIIKIKGFTEDDDRGPIGDVEVKAIVQGEEVGSTKSGSSGVFSLEFLGPNEEGNYTILLTAEKSPYISFNQNTTINVVRSVGLTLEVPETIRVGQGEKFTAEVSLINLGQTDFHNLTISINGLPREFHDFPKTLESLLAGEEKKIEIEFFVPEDAVKTAYTPSIRLSTEDLVTEQTFVFSVITPSNETQSTTTPEINLPTFSFPTLSLPTANIVLPTFGSEILYILLFAVGAFSFAYLLRRRKTKNVERIGIKNLLLDIKREVNRELKEKK